jgi:hypothetical protein
MIDIAALAATAVSSFLFPYVKQGVQQIAEAMRDRASGAAADHIAETTGKVWESVKRRFVGPKEQSTLELFAERPEAAKPLLEELLRERLKQDPAFAKELDELINAPGPDGVSATVQIRDAAVAGVIVMPHPDFSGAHDFNIVAGQNLESGPADRP